MKIEFHSVYTHFILTTFQRERVIGVEIRDRLEKYITGIIRRQHSKLYAIYANPDHVHFLVSRAPGMSEEDLATIVADSSARFINKNELVPGYFRWQQSAAAFSVSKADVDLVCKYIMNQPIHHQQTGYEKKKPQ